MCNYPLLHQSGLVPLNVVVIWHHEGAMPILPTILQNDLVVYLVVNLDVRGHVEFRGGRGNVTAELALILLVSSVLALPSIIIHVLLTLFIHLLLRHRSHLGFRRAPLPILGPRLVDRAHTVLGKTLLGDQHTRLAPIIIRHVGVARHPLIIGAREWRFLRRLPIPIILKYGTATAARIGILNKLAHFIRAKWIPNRHPHLIKILLALNTRL